MAHTRPKVAVCGSGGLSKFIIEAILRTGRWDLVILSRYAQPELSARGITVRKVNYASHSSLQRALTGIHTAISTIPDDNINMMLIEACLSARVSRFAPSEFEGTQTSRPMYANNGRDRLSVLRRLEEVRTHLESTSFVCGMLYEHFTPEGWRSYGSSWGAYVDGLLVNLRKKTATIPEDPQRGGANSILCLTSAEDVGKFVSKSLDLDFWPAELRMWGERLRVKDLIRICESIRERRFKVRTMSQAELDDSIIDAIDHNDGPRQVHLQTLQAVQQHEFNFGVLPEHFDYSANTLNSFYPEIRTLSIETFLRRYWRPSTS